MDLPESLRPKQPGWRKKGVIKKGEAGRDNKDCKISSNQNVKSHTPPGLPDASMFGGEVSTGVPTTLPTREDRASTFSYDAMAANDHAPLAVTTTATSYDQQHSPMFASASAHDFARSMARSTSPANVGVPTAGIDPQLEGMFENPAASSVEKDNPVHVNPDDDVLRDTAGEALDIFNMTHDDERDEEPMFPGTGSDAGEHGFERSHMFGDDWWVNEGDWFALGNDGANEIARIRFMANRPTKTPQPTTWAKAALLRM